jgi:uncharacterized iron-regulated protein
MLSDLSSTRVIYLGESHRLKRHHDLQEAIVRDLGARGVKLALGLEQMESHSQPILDRYNRGEISFEKLAELTDWEKTWSGYRQYRGIVEAARKAGAPILALNAKRDVIRKVARSGGVAKLDPETRSLLPGEIVTDDPLYAKLLGLYMPVHKAATSKMLRPMMEAQIARDEAMADALSRFLKSKQGEGRTAIVICGAGHCSYGLGMPDRVRRRLKDKSDRIVLMSASGDVVLTEHEKSVSREIHVKHEQVREIGRPICDYLHAMEAKNQ